MTHIHTQATVISARVCVCVCVRAPSICIIRKSLTLNSGYAADRLPHRGASRVPRAREIRMETCVWRIVWLGGDSHRTHSAFISWRAYAERKTTPGSDLYLLYQTFVYINCAMLWQVLLGLGLGLCLLLDAAWVHGAEQGMCMC